MSGPEASHKTCPKEHFGKSGEQVQDSGGLIGFLWGPGRDVILHGRPRNLSQEMCQMTFWKKWGACPRPGGTYLIFVGS
jgi:hypothetical protein